MGMGGVWAGCYIFAVRSRSAFVITETELKLIAAAAIIGFSREPESGKSTPAASGTPIGVVDEGEEQILPDIAHGRLAQSAGAEDAAQIAFEQGDAARFHGHIRARSHRNPDVGLGQRRGVVHAVAGHRRDGAFLLICLEPPQPFSGAERRLQTAMPSFSATARAVVALSPVTMTIFRPAAFSSQIASGVML